MLPKFWNEKTLLLHIYFQSNSNPAGLSTEPRLPNCKKSVSLNIIVIIPRKKQLSSCFNICSHIKTCKTCKTYVFKAFKHKKTLKMHISTSVWSAQHTKAGQNIQQMPLFHAKLTWTYRTYHQTWITTPYNNNKIQSNLKPRFGHLNFVLQFKTICHFYLVI